MKSKFYFLLLLLLFLNIGVFAIQKQEFCSSETKTIIEQESQTLFPVIQQDSMSDYWGVFWVNFAIAAIGVYSIYGFAAGFVSVGLTYFIYNGNKKAFRMAIFGALAGAFVGLAMRLLVLFI